MAWVGSAEAYSVECSNVGRKSDKYRKELPHREAAGLSWEPWYHSGPHLSVFIMNPDRGRAEPFMQKLDWVFTRMVQGPEAGQKKRGVTSNMVRRLPLTMVPETQRNQLG